MTGTKRKSSSIQDTLQWSGWQQLLTKSLSDAGGSLHWLELRDKMLSKYLEEGHSAASAEVAKIAALTCIPETFLSKEDSMVRLPKSRRVSDISASSSELPFTQERLEVIQACLSMQALGINQGTSGNVSRRVPGGFLVTGSGIAYERMEAKHIVFQDMDGGYYGDVLPSSEWRMHYDIYKKIPEAKAVVHAHPTYCTALACQRRGIPSLHYMVGAAGGKEIQCADYATFGSQELSDNMLTAMGPRRSVLLANHGMICYGATLDKALSLANETECLARQYVNSLSTGLAPILLSGEEMDVMLAKFKTYGKQPHELEKLTSFEKLHAITPPEQVESQESGSCEISFVAERQRVIDACLKMNELGINQGTSGNVSCRVPGGFLVTGSGIAYEKMLPKHVVFMDLEEKYYGDVMPSSEWRMHYDIYKAIPEAEAVVHAHPTYCTTLACQRRGIPAFHYMVGAAGGKEIQCAEYASFGTQALSDSMLTALGPRRSVLLANHGMICYGANLDKALALANETECLARQYVNALSTGLGPKILPDDEMDVMLAKFKTYGKQPDELCKLTPFERRHAIKAPPCRGMMFP